MATFFNVALEIFYIIMGIMFLYSGYSALNDHTNTKRVGSALFWWLLVIIFIAGKWLPSWISGILVVLIGCLTLFKQVGIGHQFENTDQQAETSAKKLGGKIFIPLITMAVVALVLPFLFQEAGASAVAFGALAGLLVALVIFKPTPRELIKESDRMVQQVGTTSILPQLLAALGAIFVAAGVGDVVSQLISQAVPVGSPFWGVVAYVLGMALFTMIMGNAFAAFTVITAGIGIPFVIAQGGDPVVVAALGMTAGFCGTLMTPMAGNFNVLPVALLEMKDENGVLKAQIPFALVLLVFHIVVMYFWAF
ncbi:MAG: DUF979 domain-containing protein [Aerococcus sp.]|nr:DUF979 domain-containing protein [Aerococcus sp.]